MGQFPFQDRAVAFLDILGFSEMIKNIEKCEEKNEELFKIINLLENHTQKDNGKLAPSLPNRVKPKYIFISDSVILSAPLSYDNFDGLGIVITRTIEIAHKLLDIGYLIRGGISVGSVWHYDSNVFGPAYIEAVEAEKKAIHPCVMLTESAQKHWNSGHSNNLMNAMVLPDEPIVNTPHPDYCPYIDANFTLESNFGQYSSARIIQRLRSLPTGRPREKWVWMANTFNIALQNYNIKLQKIVIPAPYTD